MPRPSKVPKDAFAIEGQPRKPKAKRPRSPALPVRTLALLDTLCAARGEPKPWSNPVVMVQPTPAQLLALLVDRAYTEEFGPAPTVPATAPEPAQAGQPSSEPALGAKEPEEGQGNVSALCPRCGLWFEGATLKKAREGVEKHLAEEMCPAPEAPKAPSTGDSLPPRRFLQGASGRSEGNMGAVWPIP